MASSFRRAHRLLAEDMAAGLQRAQDLPRVIMIVARHHDEWTAESSISASGDGCRRAAIAGTDGGSARLVEVANRH